MRVWSTREGLPSDAITAIIQTRDGFLWIGTGAGLVRFDGARFTEQKLTTSTAGEVRVSALCEDSDSHLWVGTQQQGLFELDRGQLRHLDQRQGLSDPNVTCLAADEHGQVWIGTKAGLSLWTGKEFKSYGTRDGLPSEWIAGVNAARSGAVWITTRVGMCRYLNGEIGPYTFETASQGRSPEYLGAYEDRRGNLWAFGDTYLINLTEGKRFNYFRSSESPSVRIWSLCEGQDGRLWIGTSGRGLYCFEDNRFQPVRVAEDRWPYDVRALCEDQKGDLWLGTSGGGLVQLRRQSVHVLRTDEGLPLESPTALALDPNGRAYVGLERGGLFAEESGRFDRAAGAEALGPNSCVAAICVGRDWTVWAGTLGNGLYGLRNGRGVHLTSADGLEDDTILALGADSDGSLWVGTRAGGLQRLSAQDGCGLQTVRDVPRTQTTAILVLGPGDVWLGLADGQIWHETNDHFELITRAGKHPVLALLQTEPGKLWVGTGGGGLTLLSDGTNANWSLNNGLPSGTVAGLITDQAGNLWFAASTGLYRVQRKYLPRSAAEAGQPLVCELMSGARTSVESAEFVSGMRAARSPDGTLWFATDGGVLNANTMAASRPASTFPVCLESAAFNGQAPLCLLQGPLWSGPGDAALAAPGDLRSLEIHFTALDFDTPEEVRFRHKLEGQDLEWIDDGGTRVARYGRLSYGRYRFRVAARRAEGNWQECAQSFAFIVPTPLYYQAWAVGLYVITGLALVVGTVRLVSHRRLTLALERLEQQQLVERERLRIARDMHDEMGSKLTKISFLSEHAQVEAKAAPAAAEDKVRAIAQTSRELLKTMDEIVWVVNPRNDTLENLTAYLSHYAVEYFQNTCIACELSLPEELPQAPLSSETRHNLFLTFEEALNNVLKHSAATRVTVEMRVEGKQFRLTVSDNGIGFSVPSQPNPAASDRSPAGGNGLHNMRQRLAAIGGECQVASRPGAGTTVTIRIALAKHSPL